MSSFRSRLPPDFQQNASSQDSQRPKQASRIPTKQSTAEANKQSGQTALSTSRSAKRISGSLDKQATKSTSIIAQPVTVAHSPSNSSKRLSAAYSPATSSRHSMLPPPPTIRTPSLVSGSSASTLDSPRSVLRRKPSGAIDRYAAQRRAEKPEVDPDHSAMHNRSEMYVEDLDDAVLGILPPNSLFAESDIPIYLDPKLDYDSRHGTSGVAFNVTPPIPMYAQPSTPSTRYSDSPLSHAPTFSSMSSYSSGLPALSDSSLRQSAKFPKEQPKGKDDTARLTPVRESSTSSSNKTVKPKDIISPSKQNTSIKESAATSSTKSSEIRDRPSRRKLKKEQVPPTSTKKQGVQKPPEFAHLDTPSVAKAVQRPGPPRRPSRDGTTNIADMNEARPVVQSDLPRLHTPYHKQTPSQDTPVSASSPSFKSRFGMSSKSSSRTVSPRIDSAISPPPVARAFTSGSTPDIASNGSNNSERIGTPVVGTNSSPPKSQRFGFFSRKSKSEAMKVAEKPKRPATKGPVAGTGHEGYKFGYRGRSGSASSSNGFRSPSADSSTSSAPRPQPSRNSSLASKDGSELDDFLRERLNPVVLRGSGITSTVSSSTWSSDLQAVSLKHVPSNLSVASSIKPQLLPSAMQKTSGTSPQKRRARDRRESSDLSDDGLMPSLQRSANRVSHISRNHPSPETARGPQSTSPTKSSRSPRAGTDEVHSSLLDNAAMPGNEGSWLRSASVEPLRKPSRKYPFFQRAQPSSHNKSETSINDNMGTFRASPARNISRAVPQYGMLEPVAPVDLDEIARLFLDAELSPEDSMSETSMPPRMGSIGDRRQSSLSSSMKSDNDANQDPFDESRSPRDAKNRLDSTESPELPRARTVPVSRPPVSIDAPQQSPQRRLGKKNIAFVQPSQVTRNAMTPEPKVLLETPQQQSSNESPRPPRLSPVGRIPRVVSTRDRDRKLPDTSFSRPFARNQPKPNAKPPGSVYTQIRDMATSPVDMSSTSTRSDGNSADRRSGTFTAAQSTSRARTSLDVHANAEHEFLAFPPRKNSDQSYSSSSASQSWNIAAYVEPFEHDDIWSEYDDLMDDVMIPRVMTTDAPVTIPVQAASNLHQQYAWPPLKSGPPTTELPLPPGSSSIPGVVPTVLSIPDQIARLLQPSLSPLMSDTISAIMGDYANGSTDMTYAQNRASLQLNHTSGIPQPRRASMASTVRTSFASSCDSRNSEHSRSSSLPERNVRNSQSSITKSRTKRNTKLLDIPEDCTSVAKLRYGALMTSKWLSFGRILFSPGHNAVLVSDDPRILIVDGLSSDWSFYVAQSYPTAAVYNLFLDQPDAEVEMWPGGRKPPRNHFQIPWKGMSAQMPFPRGFFNVVVFRFPVAASEEAYRLCVSECKRVLRPGGFLELAVLDLDLMNMGSRARRVIRDMKTGIQMRDQDVSLGNLSDVLLRLICRRGFEEVQRCIVGVPAAGRIPNSVDGSSIGSDGSGRISWQPEDLENVGGEVSFADLLKHSGEKFRPGHSNDEDITRMVAKIGRWWYASCYERPYYPPHRSIWRDRSLLRECEVQGTSFRLLICHAQKPTQPRRRTVSV